MTRKPPKPTKTRRPSPAKKLRNIQITAMALEGKPIQEIAKAVGLERHQITAILSSKEMAELVKQAESRVHGLIGKAIDTLDAAMDSRMDMASAVRSALAILKGTGALKDKLELKHTYPKPVIIEKLDGSTVVLGHEQDDEGDTE
jgi:hypothetical protein